MSSVVISGDVSGSVTLSAPSTAGSTTLTLPATTGNILTDTGGVTPGTSGNVLTSNGTTWTSAALPASGGMTLLSTLNTTSGTTVTASGLNLTSYKMIWCFFVGVTSTVGSQGALYIASTSSKLTGNTNGPINGNYYFDLFSGGGFTSNNNSLTNIYYTNSGYTTSTTSIVFGTSASTFNGGTIYIYGVK